MTKLQLLSAAVVALLALNVTVIALMLQAPAPVRGAGPGPGGRGGPRDERRPRTIVIDRLGFDDEQTVAYDALIAENMLQIRALERQLVQAKQAQFTTLGTVQPSVSDTAWAEISGLLLQIEQTRYQHFLDIKGLCRADQLPAFQALSQDLADIFRPANRRPPPR